MTGVEYAPFRLVGGPLRRPRGLLPAARHLHQLRTRREDLDALATGGVLRHEHRAFNPGRGAVGRHRGPGVPGGVLDNPAHPELLKPAYHAGHPAVLVRAGRTEKVELEPHGAPAPIDPHQRSAPLPQRDARPVGRGKRGGISPDARIAPQRGSAHRREGRPLQRAAAGAAPQERGFFDVPSATGAVEHGSNLRKSYCPLLYRARPGTVRAEIIISQHPGGLTERERRG